MVLPLFFACICDSTLSSLDDDDDDNDDDDNISTSLDDWFYSFLFPVPTTVPDFVYFLVFLK